jgi:hypothetical protein
MITFADFQPGAVLGERKFAFDDAALAQWLKLFPDDRGTAPLMPPAMIAMVIMRAFTDVLRDRPPGNIHARQTFGVTRLPTLNELLVTTLSCRAKELKRERRWVIFGFDAIDVAKAPVFRGEMTTVWAA